MSAAPGPGSGAPLERVGAPVAPDPLPRPGGSVPPVDPVVFRRVFGRFATGVTVLTTVADGHDHAMTANTLTSVSIDPLLMLVCLRREGRFHDAVLEAGTWGVSILPATARGAAAWLATPGRPLHGQLDRIPHGRGPATGVPLLDDALAHLECRTTAVHEGGDHSIVVGEVVTLAGPDEVGEALLFYRGEFRSLR